MAEKLESEKKTEQEVQTAEQYAQAIKNLKDKTVDKEAYDKVVAERETLIKALSGEGPVPEGVQEGQKPADIKELKKRFQQAEELGLTNAEVVETALELRKALIESGQPDPFLPIGAKVKPTLQDIEGADRSAKALQAMLDAARDESGKVDPEMFNAQLRKNIAEDSPLLTARLRANQQTAKKR